MALKLDSPEKLFVHELKDLFSAENQILKALPKMEAAAQSSQLKKGFAHHHKQTQGHVSRLEKIFQQLDFSPTGHHCKGMEGLLEEGEEILKENDDLRIRDLALISAAQRVEHYEMAGYGTARSMALKLGYDDAAKLLGQTLDEESQTDEELTKIADSLD